MHSRAQITVTQNGLAPGNDAGACVATSTASGIETNEMFRITFALGEMSRTRPDDWRAKCPEAGVCGDCVGPAETAMSHRSSRGEGLRVIARLKGLCAGRTRSLQ